VIIKVFDLHFISAIMNIKNKCKVQVMPNVWHHNLIINSINKVYKEVSEVPSEKEDVIMLIKDGIAIPEDGWIVNCEDERADE